MIGAMSVCACTMYTVHTTKMYDTWDSGRVGKVSGIEVTGRVLGMPDPKPIPGSKLIFGRPKCT